MFIFVFYSVLIFVLLRHDFLRVGLLIFFAITVRVTLSKVLVQWNYSCFTGGTHGLGVGASSAPS